MSEFEYDEAFYDEHLDIAIVGLTGRFPGAENLAEFWENLRQGVESIRPLDDDTLRARGVSETALQDPTFVKVDSSIEDMDKFDAAFFDYTPREAEIMDPQQRIFLECSWQALEHAGYDPERYKGLIGVYAGATTSNYLLYNLATNRDLLSDIDAGQIDIGNGSDFLATRVSYKLNLRGPSFTVQTACSTSLVSVHLACQALLDEECDMALAGGICIHVDHPKGYYFVEGSILSADGHVRAFDADAVGSVFGSGVGVVVLKRLEDALRDDDQIYAVIKGTAINNDGSDKVGYVAPSVEGQASVIAEALSVAGVDPDTINYVETHGAGTILGDPIEIRALTKAYRTSTDRNQFCAIGSVKTNVGHLTGAAGIAGLIKTVLALHHKTIPPTLNFERPNPEIDFANSPFFPNTEARKWEAESGLPRRAGVSSFGLGGTNAHAILQEAPVLPASEPTEEPQLFLFSAQSEQALTDITHNLADYLVDNPELNLADVAFTLNMGRQPFNYRHMVMGQSVEEVTTKLRDETAVAHYHHLTKQHRCPIAFIFPDRDENRSLINAARDLYESEPDFREHIEHCGNLSRTQLGFDVSQLLYPTADQIQAAEKQLARPEVAAVTLFALEYALAQLWLEWGIQPQAMMGVGVGELAAACLSGAFSVEDGLTLVMASVSGTAQARHITLNVPQKPYLSSVSGTWITTTQATDHDYYRQVIVSAPRLNDCLQELLQDPYRILLEVGPGQSLAQAAQPQIDILEARSVLTTVANQEARAHLQHTLGQLWLADAPIDWAAVYRHQERRRLPLPTYPFERRRFWIEPGNPMVSSAMEQPLYKKEAVADWFYTFAWHSKAPPRPFETAALTAEKRNWLLFGQDLSGEETLITALQGADQQVTVVTTGDSFSSVDEQTYQINPANPEDYVSLLAEMAAAPDHIVHLWSCTSTEPTSDHDPTFFNQVQQSGFYTLVYLARALAEQAGSEPVQIEIVSNQVCQVIETESLQPAKATLLSICQVLPQEYPQLTCRLIDIPYSGGELPAEQLLAEFVTRPEADGIVAYRGRQRWLRSFAPAPIEAGLTAQRPLRQEGVYLIVGGQSDIGFDLARHLARNAQVRLALLATRARDEEAIAALEAEGATEVLVIETDLSQEEAVQTAVAQVLDHYGQIHGLIHAPSVPGEKAFCPLQELNERSGAWHFEPKALGLLAMARALEGQELDFYVLTSALSTVLGGIGFAAFTGAAHFLNAFAQQQRQRNGSPWLSINWDVWQVDEDLAQLDSVGADLSQLALTPTEGGAVLERILDGATTPSIIVSTGDLALRLQQMEEKSAAMKAAGDQKTLYERPDLFNEYIEPRNEIERQVVEIWEQVLGIKQIGVEDNFFDLGGHSLLATQLRNHIHNVFGIELPLRSLFDDPTAAGIATILERQLSSEAAEPQQPLGERLQEAFPAERQGIMEDYLTRRIALGLNLEAEEIPEDGALTDFDMQLTAVDLMWSLKQELKVQFYPHEITSQERIADLADFVLTQKERMDNLPAHATQKPLSAYTLRQHRRKGERRERPPIAPEDKNKGMAFLLSSPRAGSTLLRVMLAGHPDIFCPPEISLLFFHDMQEWQENVSFGQDFQWPAEGLHWALVELLGLETDEGWQLIEDIVTENRTVQSIYAQLQELSEEKWVVDKTPPYAMDMETLERAEEIFDSPRYIHLVRHPYAMINSFLKVRLDQQFSSSLFEEENPDPYVIAETIWLHSNRNLLNFFNQVDDERHFFVRYEDLVKTPEPIMRDLCRFLEIDFAQSLLTPYDGRRERMMGGVGDPNILQHTGIDPTLADVWKKIQLPRYLDPDTQAIATQLGYELPDNILQTQPQQTASPDTSPSANIEQNIDDLSDEEVSAMLSELLATEGD